MKTISLTKKDTESILQDVERALSYANKKDNDPQSHSVKLGYLEQTLKAIKKQLTGEYSIIHK